jgi:hypothetical protein
MEYGNHGFEQVDKACNIKQKETTLTPRKLATS